MTTNTLTALMTKLQWQLEAIEQELRTQSEHINALDTRIEATRQKITQASATPGFIIPEREIASMHFIMNQQQTLDALHADKATCCAHKNTLEAKQLRLKTEIKMLEKYQETQRAEAQKQTLRSEQNVSDEWTAQQGTRS